MQAPPKPKSASKLATWPFSDLMDVGGKQQTCLATFWSFYGLPARAFPTFCKLISHCKKKIVTLAVNQKTDPNPLPHKNKKN